MNIKTIFILMTCGVLLLSCQEGSQQVGSSIRVTDRMVDVAPATVEENFQLPSISLDFDAAEVENADTEVHPWTRSPVNKELHARSYSNEYTPACSQMETNTIYTLAPETDGVYCAYFDMPENARADFFVYDQADGRQMDLEVYQDIQGNYEFTQLGASRLSSAEDSVSIYAERGHYYMQMLTVESDGADVHFAVAVNTNVDGYEGNDTPANAYDMPKDMNYIEANLDWSGDVDYYRYTLTHNKDIAFGFSGTDQDAAVYLNAQWYVLETGKSYSLPAKAGDVLYFRVTQKSGIENDPAQYYHLNMVTPIKSFGNFDIDTTETLVGLPYGMSPYIQVHNELNWQARLTDSAGEGVSGATVKFLYSLPILGEDAVVASAITDANGYVKATEIIPDCHGDYDTGEFIKYFVGHRSIWESRYDIGLWMFAIPEANELSSSEPRELAQICREKLIKVLD
ncbi:Ig-like domain-containing protein [Gynuella sp.]|uniref:Ig-like domain-containing protein n=1 Tax=Gynuella sp. TaxID=2969146 RepID=UPI003D0CB322